MTTSYIQGSIRTPANAGIQIITGAGSVVWSTTAGTVYDSVDDLLSAWNTSIAATGATIAVRTLGGTTGKIGIDTADAGTFSLLWSATGDGTAIRDYLGGVGTSLGSVASGTLLTNRHVAGFYPSLPAVEMTRTRTYRPRGWIERLMGHQTQAHTGTGSDDMIDLRVTFQLSTAEDDYTEMAHFEQCIDDIFDQSAIGVQPPFSVFHDGQQYRVHWQQPENITLQYERQPGAADGLHRVTLELAVVEVV